MAVLLSVPGRQPTGGPACLSTHANQIRSNQTKSLPAACCALCLAMPPAAAAWWSPQLKTPCPPPPPASPCTGRHTHMSMHGSKLGGLVLHKMQQLQIRPLLPIQPPRIRPASCRMRTARASRAPHHPHEHAGLPADRLHLYAMPVARPCLQRQPNVCCLLLSLLLLSIYAPSGPEPANGGESHMSGWRTGSRCSSWLAWWQAAAHRLRELQQLERMASLTSRLPSPGACLHGDESSRLLVPPPPAPPAPETAG